MKRNIFMLLMAGMMVMAGCSAKSEAPAEPAVEETTDAVEETTDAAEETKETEAAEGEKTDADSGATEAAEGEKTDADSGATEGIDSASALEELYSIQLNYSQGTAPLMEIPVPLVEAVYNDYDNIEGKNIENAPISLREYAETNVVYFDYSTDYSIKWEKDTGNITVEETDVAAREDFKQKAHK